MQSPGTKGGCGHGEVHHSEPRHQVILGGFCLRHLQHLILPAARPGEDAAAAEHVAAPAAQARRHAAAGQSSCLMAGPGTQTRPHQSNGYKKHSYLFSIKLIITTISELTTDFSVDLNL